jgi:hypothetical protein
MAEGDRTPGGEPPTGPGERDTLAARRARRAELGDAALMRRAEAAEATVRTLESHLADLRRRVREAEEEQRRAAEQLAEREHEVRRVKQREYAEQQLRVEAEEQRERLEREQRGELDRLQRRLASGERHARELADRLEVVRRELSEAEQEASTGHAAARRAEQRLVEREADLARRELLLGEQIQEMGRTRARVEAIVRELAGIAAQLRRAMRLRAAAAEPTREEPDREEMAQALAAAVARLRARVAAPVEPAREEPQEPEVERAPVPESERAPVPELEQQPEVEAEAVVPASGSEVVFDSVAPTRARAPEQQSEAVVSASEAAVRVPEAESVFKSVAPTRAREQASKSVVQSPELEPEAISEAAQTPEPVAAPAPPTARTPEPASAPYTPRVLALTAERKSWLAPAIRRVAEGRDTKLAGELICELLPIQRVKRGLSYTLRIEGLGDVQVRIEHDRVIVRRPSAAGGAGAVSAPVPERGAFLLEGPAAAFAELAAGGAGRRLAGVKVHGSRRKLRRLLSTRRVPLAMSDLAEAGVQVWPGLLLLALSEAIALEWTTGHSFVMALAIQGPPSATLYVQARDGEPFAVTRVRGEAPLSTVRLSERAFLCMLAGAPLPPGEQVLVEGPTKPLELLLEWSDRAQGLPR